MSKRNDKFLLEDIIESIEAIQNYTREMTLEGFLSDRKTRDAVARNFEIMGEAVARMNADFKASNSQIDWRDLKVFRNLLIHSYEIVDYPLVWSVITKELPPLYLQIQELFKQLK